jgi:hypothetical protein
MTQLTPIEPCTGKATSRRECSDAYNVAAAHNPHVAPDKSVVVKHDPAAKAKKPPARR